MRDTNFSLGWIFRITAICGSLLTAGRYSGFLFMFAVVSLALCAGCFWYAAMRRAPGPTLHLTIAFLLLTPLLAVLFANVQLARETARRQQAINRLRDVGLEMQLLMRARPELAGEGNEALYAQALLRQRPALRFRGERERR